MATRIKSSQIADGSIVAADLHSAIAVSTTASGTFGTLNSNGLLTVVGGDILINDGSSNNERSVRLQNSSVTGYLGIEGSSANRFVGSTANNMFLGTTTADGIQFATNNTVRATIDSSGDAVFSGDLTVTGDLTVEGAQVSLNTTALDVEDKNITLNYHASNDTSASADQAGITIQDAVSSGNDATILWDATDDKFVVSHTIDVTGDVLANGLTVDGTANINGSTNINSNFGGFLKFTRTDTTSVNNNDIGAINFAHQDTDDAGTAATILASGDGTAGEVRLSVLTGTPTDRLERLRIKSSGDISFYENNGGTPQVGMHWDYTDGQLGVGTTSPTSTVDIRGPNGAVQSRGQLYLSNTDTAAIDNGSQISLGGTYSGTGDTYFAAIAGRKENSTVGDYHGYLQLSTRQTSGNIERMRITSDGNVGIGTDAPITALHIEDDNPNSFGTTTDWTVQASDSLSLINTSNSDGDQITSLYMRASGNGGNISARQILRNTSSGSGEIHWQMRDAAHTSTTNDKMILKSSGQLGIGISPQAQLHVNGDIRVDGVSASGGAVLRLSGTGNASLGDSVGTIEFHNADATDYTPGVFAKIQGVAHASGGEGALQFVVDMPSEGTDADQVAMYIAPTSNVGIGTDSPDSKLTVNVTSNGDGIELQSSEVTIATLDRTVVGGQVVASLDGVASRPIHIGGVINEDVILANAGGKVGIGTNITPTYKLDVDGAIATRQVRHSVRPSLLLDFANSKKIDPRMSFTRSTTGTYWDGKTTVKAEENLWFPSTGYGQEGYLDDSTVVVTNNSATAPDGTNTAAKVQDNSAQTSHYIVKADTAIYTSQIHTISFYVKYGSGYGWVGIGLASSKLAWFDVQNGTQGSEHSSVQSASITSAGNGWYRCVVVINPTNTTDYWQIRLCNADNTVTYTANGSYVYVWGAQLERRSSATQYTPTTSVPVVKYQPVLQTAATNIPRFDHDPVTSESKGLLIEEARTNYAPLSTPGTGWAQSTQMVTPNYAIAPDGTHTAGFIHESATAIQQLTYTNAGNVLTSGNTYTFSVYAKAYTHDTFQMHSFGDNSKTFYLSSPSSGSDSTMTDVGNGWYRCTWTRTKSNTTGTLYLGFSGSSYAGDANKGVLFWGAQLEPGTFATSLIPTAGSTVTRGLDELADYSIQTSGWFSSYQGTMFADYTLFGSYVDAPYSRIHVTSTVGYRTTLEMMNYGGQVYHNFFLDNSLKFNQTRSAAVNTKISGAMSWDFNQSLASSAINGTHSNSGGITGVPQRLERLFLGTSGFNAHIRKFAFYQKHFSNDELVALTEE